MTEKRWDLLITGAKVFDGSGHSPWTGDVAVSKDRVEALGQQLDRDAATEVINADGLWLVPGLLDIHTHFDLEVELAPGLQESVRHGTTTVVVANCSLGLAFGAQRKNGQDPLVDCFARVENVPKPILSQVAEQAVWDNSADYLTHLDDLPLGPNIVPMIPHSMLRIQVMGMKESISRQPTQPELEEMERLLETGMQQGYAGFSTDALPFHFLANDPNRQRRIPTQYASFSETKKLTSVVRRHGRVWQATPAKDSKLSILKHFLLTSGRIYGKPLKITAVAALDIAANRSIAKLSLVLSKLFNSKLLRGHFRLQALAARFKVWGEGPITPLFEEIPELRLLNEPDLEDREARLKILNDPQYVKAFKRMWYKGKSGFGLARLKRFLVREDYAIRRDLADMVIDDCPVDVWKGETMQAVYRRLTDYQQTRDDSLIRSEAERNAFKQCADPIGDDADFLLHLLRIYDIDLYWYTVSANQDPQTVRDLLMHPLLLPGFNDSGAHLTNMAFYDCNLRALKIAAQEGDEQVAYTVKRLTREPAEFFGVEAGSIAEQTRADLVLIDPAKLKEYDGEASIQRFYREEFGYHQLVNRSDGVVRQVFVAGQTAWQGDQPGTDLGKQKMGRVLTATVGTG